MYSYLANFGDTKPSNPLTYCAVSGLESGFNNTLGNAYLSPNGAQCQAYMSQYCAKNWDGVCEYLNQDTSKIYPVATQPTNLLNHQNQSSALYLTKGQLLLRNTAMEKYLKQMSDNCELKYEAFDPTVANSPLIHRWVTRDTDYTYEGCSTGGGCIPVYDVVASSIDDDIVMDKLLAQPWIVLDIFSNIFNTRVREGTMQELEGTNIGYFLMSDYFLRSGKGIQNAKNALRSQMMAKR